MRFRQYDAIPLAPTGLTITESANNHPLLSWSPNPEPDLYNYIIYKKVSSEFGFQYLNTSATTSYEDGTETYPYPGGPGVTHPVWYYVKAQDINSHVSNESNTVITYVSGASPEKRGASKTSNPTVYYLEQNYPNPFNPTTTINSSGLVTLKIYDMLGMEVTSLVNEMKEAGNYSVSFNASSAAGGLPSGIYFYTLTSGNFRDTKKLILLK